MARERKQRRIMMRPIINQEQIILRKWALTRRVDTPKGDAAILDDCRCVAESILASVADHHGRQPDAFICRRDLYRDAFYWSDETTPGKPFFDVLVSYRYGSTWCSVSVAVDR